MDFSYGTAGKEIRGPRYVLVDVEAQCYQPQAAAGAGSVHDVTEGGEHNICGMTVPSFFIVCASAVVALQLWAAFSDDASEPRLFVRLLRAQGLGLDDPWESPAFELAVDVGGPGPLFLRRPIDVDHDALLRVSYRGAILAWGSVPPFTVDGERMGPCLCPCAACVATVVARAEGSVVRQEMRKLIRAEQQVFGRAEFDVDGEIPGLDGHLYCKAYLFKDKCTERPPPCWVQKKQNQDSW